MKVEQFLEVWQPETGSEFMAYSYLTEMLDAQRLLLEQILAKIKIEADEAERKFHRGDLFAYRKSMEIIRKHKIDITLSPKAAEKALDDVFGTGAHNLMIDTLKRVKGDYAAVMKICQIYSLHACYKDAVETLAYLDKVINQVES